MKLTIIFRDENREVECEYAEVKENLLYVYSKSPTVVYDKTTGVTRDVQQTWSVKQIWNMNNIIGVEMD